MHSDAGMRLVAQAVVGACDFAVSKDFFHFLSFHVILLPTSVRCCMTEQLPLVARAPGMTLLCPLITIGI